jgi:two-component system response regulator LytT
MKIEKRNRLPVTMDRRMIFLPLDEIVYVETQNHVCRIHTRNAVYSDNRSLNSLEEQMQNHGFLRIQKSFLVNLEYVRELYQLQHNTYCVVLDGFEDEIIPVSRSQVKHLKELMCQTCVS